MPALALWELRLGYGCAWYMRQLNETNQYVSGVEGIYIILRSSAFYGPWPKV